MRPGLTAQLLAVATTATLAWLGACSDDDPSAATGAASTSGGGAGGEGGVLVLVGAASGGPPPLDDELCGNQFHDVEFDSPALYFVLDASGSMAELLEGTTRYSVLRGAVVDLVSRLGDRVRVGAAVFPEGTNQSEACRPGDEVFPLKLGDSIADDGAMGPVTTAFADAIDVTPEGGTPTAVTLRAVRRALASAAGRRAVVLVTDGGPNCNSDISCDASTCIPNIEETCPVGVDNCCDPLIGGTFENCLDRAETLDAISELRELGVTVHVIGISGSGAESTTLGQMAILGGAPASAPPFYQRADDVDTLAAVLSEIAVVEGSCTFQLDEPPPVTWRTNVWLDASRIDYDSSDGWMWSGAPLDYVPVEPPPTTGSTTSSGGGGGAADGGGGTAGSGGAAGSGGTAGSGGAGLGGSGGERGGGGEGGGPEVDTSAIELRGEACRRFTSGEVRRVQIVTGCPTTTPN